MTIQFKEKRARLQRTTSLILPVVLVGGWLYPPLGISLLICMFGAIGIAFYNGRAWCDWMCPRGSFYDLFLQKISRKMKIPEFFKTNRFRTLILTALMLSLGIQIYRSWGDLRGIGFAFVMVLTITTTAGIVLGSFFKPRAWCQICPMGTLGYWIAGGKRPLYVSEHCRKCNLCEKICPMQLKPHEYKSGKMADGDCIKCNSCVHTCPINALEFKEEIKNAA